MDNYNVGDITPYGEITLFNWVLDFIQFCEPGSNGTLGVHSMTFEEIYKDNQLKGDNNG